jgi:transglutaminase-like putative cysteine protease
MDRTTRSRLVPLFALGLLPAIAVAGVAGDPSDHRTFEFVYQARIGPIEAGQGPVHVFVPLVLENEHQHVVSEKVDVSIPGQVETEPEYGNRFWHGSLAQSDGKPIEVRVDTVVERRLFHAAPAAGASADPAELARYLQPDRLVPVGDKVLDPILADIRKTAGAGADRAVTARTTYDWVVDHLEYKKVGTGWGNGDTFWACSARYGNCTDFHSLFISLARTEGIPARFEIGFPVPDDRPAGDIGGYHCWTEFWLPGTGWFPIDASEAFKHPEKRDLFYGTQPTDRVHFTTGRDLRLGPDHHGQPLNYFVYPYVEVDGKAWTGTIEKTFSYRDEAPAPATATSK